MPPLNFTPFPELRTERLLLRKLAMDDTDSIFFLRSDETVLKFIGREPATSIEEAAAFIKRINDAVDASESVLWGITQIDKPETIIGTICYWRLQPENFRAEIGYLLHPDFWKKGIMKEAIQKVLEYGFKSMKLHSIEARISPGNIASAAVLEATGFVKEAHLRDEFFFRGKFSDTIIYGRLE